MSLRVLHLNSVLATGGTDDQCVRLVQGLRHLEIDAEIAGPDWRRYGAITREAGIPLHVTPREGPAKLRLIAAVAKVIRQGNHQIVHGHHGRDLWATVLAARLSGRRPKIVLTRHLAKSPSSLASRWFLLGRIDRMICVSEFVAQVVREGHRDAASPEAERHWRPPMRGDLSKLRVIHGGIDTARSRPRDDDAVAALRKAWGLSGGEYAFAIVGAFFKPRGKGHREFLRAAALAHRRLPQARFLIIGQGDLEDTLREDIRRLGLDGVAQLTGHCADMPAAMNAIDCLVHPQIGTEGVSRRGVGGARVRPTGDRVGAGWHPGGLRRGVLRKAGRAGGCQCAGRGHGAAGRPAAAAPAGRTRALPRPVGRHLFAAPPGRTRGRGLPRTARRRSGAMKGAPGAYSSLRGFEDCFAAGIPVLMYHKLGPRPRKVRLKGLYVSEPMYRRQLQEWTAAGFGPALVTDVGLQPGNPQRRVVLTFDDGFENVLRYGVPLMRTHGFTAIQYLVADLLGKTNEWEQREGEAAERLMDPAQVREWMQAGHEIGAHTCTHPFLTRIPLAQAREEITASRKKLEDLFGVPVRHFCYPYGDWNPAVRDVVAEAGYETAVITAAGINEPGTDRLALKRFTVRYASRNWKNLCGAGAAAVRALNPGCGGASVPASRGLIGVGWTGSRGRLALPGFLCLSATLLRHCR
jgi:peptidoglycan/xylan/chitin deacetylase (PgdA/CDA1 family)/glycosyltransferase involved in cell wall biosynthesis